MEIWIFFHTTMGSSKLLSKDFRMKMVHFPQEGEGSHCFKLLIKKLKTNGTVEVKARSGRPRKISDRMTQALVRNAQKNPHITAKELQKMSSTGLAVHNNTTYFKQQRPNMAELPERMTSTQN